MGFCGEKIDKRMVGWIGNILSIGEMVTLTNACLSSIPLCTLSFLDGPEGSVKKMNTIRARMTWQEKRTEKIYHLVNWPSVCLPK